MYAVKAHLCSQIDNTRHPNEICSAVTGRAKLVGTPVSVNITTGPREYLYLACC